MKKLALGIAACSLAAVICFGLVACGEEENAAKSLVGEEVTEEEWNAAFWDEGIDNIKIELESNTTVSFEYGGKISESLAKTIILADNRYYSTVKTSGYAPEDLETMSVYDTYAELTKDDFFAWKKVEQQWSPMAFWESMSIYDVMDDFSVGMCAEELTEGESLEYDAYEYSEVDKGYVLYIDDPADFDNDELGEGAEDVLSFSYKTIIKFQAGKVAAIVVVVDAVVTGENDFAEGVYGGNVTVRMERTLLFTYGGQKITRPSGLPEYAI